MEPNVEVISINKEVLMLLIQNTAYIRIIITGVVLLAFLLGLLTLLKFVPPMFEKDDKTFAKGILFIIFGFGFLACIINLASNFGRYYNPQAEAVSRINRANKLVSGE